MPQSTAPETITTPPQSCHQNPDLCNLQHVSMSKHPKPINTYEHLPLLTIPLSSTLLTSIPLRLRIRKRHLPLLTRRPLENWAIHIFETIVPRPTSCCISDDISTRGVVTYAANLHSHPP